MIITKFSLLWGGIPWYLEQITHDHLAEWHINNLCFQPDGLLVHEFERIFHDLFGSHGSIYKKIIYSLRDGMKTQIDIRDSIDYAHSGTLEKLIHNLIIFIESSISAIFSIRSKCNFS